ncbi:MAG TPA: DUF935 family protein [Sumerlaeia bacterium]|nr:DUF935 family protein [Sumerlaeia bacterium]
MTTRLQPILNEMTGPPRRLYRGAWLDAPDWPSHIIRSEGFRGSGLGGLFELFDEMEEKDGHLFAVLQTRKNGVLSCPRKVVAASDAPRDQEVARFVERTLKNIRGFDQSLAHVLDALGKGVSVQEIIWEAREGRIGVRELKSRAPGRFIFAKDGALRLNPWDAVGIATGNSLAGPRDEGPEQTPLQAPAAEGRVLPDRKFLRMTFGGLHDSPYGRGLCLHAYWYYWFKNQIVLEKRPSPAAPFGGGLSPRLWG